MTTAIRLVPSPAGASPQIASKPSAARRGFAESCEFSLTENRKPITSPSAGLAVAGPWLAYVHSPPSLSQNDQ